MSDPKEIITIRQVHDNDKYVIKRTITEEVNGEALVKIHKEITEGIKTTEQQITEWDEQKQQRSEQLEKQRATLMEREKLFYEKVKHLSPAAVAEAQTKDSEGTTGVFKCAVCKKVRDEVLRSKENQRLCIYCRGETP